MQKPVGMDKKNQMILITGLLLLVVIFFIDFLLFQDLYFTGIAAIIFAVVGMSLFIMQDSTYLPDIGITLKEDAKGVRVINQGNDTAYGIHVTLVPHNIEFDVATLEADATSDYPLSTMLTEAKAIVTYKSKKGVEYSRTTRISALGSGDDDLLKPMFPLFRWK